MSPQLLLELFGYLGSLLVIISMLMTSVMRLRVINTVGSLLFAIYAILIHSYPTALMNLFLAGINIYHLIRLKRADRHFELLRLGPEDGLVTFLLEHYREDWKKYFPSFDSAEGADGEAGVFVVLSDTTPAGLLIGEEGEGGSLNVLLDYSTPVYRDCSVGAYLYGRLPEHGIGKLICRPETPEHEAYLKKMGFAQEASGAFRLDL